MHAVSGHKPRSAAVVAGAAALAVGAFALSAPMAQAESAGRFATVIDAPVIKVHDRYYKRRDGYYHRHGRRGRHFHSYRDDGYYYDDYYYEKKRRKKIRRRVARDVAIGIFGAFVGAAIASGR